jgi:hypothetical protein
MFLPWFQSDIAEILKARQHDAEENVRSDLPARNLQLEQGDRGSMLWTQFMRFWPIFCEKLAFLKKWCKFYKKLAVVSTINAGFVEKIAQNVAQPVIPQKRDITFTVE